MGYEKYSAPQLKSKLKNMYYVIQKRKKVKTHNNKKLFYSN